MSGKPLALVALLFAGTVELLRAAGPLLDAVAGGIGIIPAAGVAIGLFVLPGAVLGTLRRLSAPVIVVFLFLARAVAQFVPNIAIVGAGAVLGMIALAVAVRRAGSGAVTGLLAGGVLDLVIRSMTVTWDPIWTFWWGLPMVALFAVAAWLALSSPPPDPDAPVNGRIWVLGCYLALWTTTIGSPSFAASQSGLALGWVIPVMLAGLAVSAELSRRPGIPGWAGLPMLLAGVAAAWWSTETAIVLSGLVLAQAGAALALRSALAKQSNRGTWVYGLVWVLPVLLFQLNYDMPLPFDNRLLILGTAAILGLAAVSSKAYKTLHARQLKAKPAVRTEPKGPLSGSSLTGRPATDGPLAAARGTMTGPISGKTGSAGPLQTSGTGRVRKIMMATAQGSLLILVAFAMLVPAAVWATAPDSRAKQPEANGFRLMSWNIKYGRDDASGTVNPQQLADAIRAADPDVVVLQEVSRGWTIGGGVDVAEYLARDLGMTFHWGPAADGQFGNLLLSRLPVTNVQTGQLPFGQGPMMRSYLKATVGGVDLLTTHLTHKKQNTPTRLDQIESVLTQEPDVVAGDLNFWPTWSEPLAFARGGMFSAQDAAGYPPVWTSPGAPATNRVDWIFGTPKVVFSQFEVLSKVTASDHLPLVTTVSLRWPSA